MPPQVPSAAQLSPQHPPIPPVTPSLDDTSTAEHFLDDYFQRHISEQDEAQYDSFNDYQLDYSH